MPAVDCDESSHAVSSPFPVFFSLLSIVHSILLNEKGIQPCQSAHIVPFFTCSSDFQKMKAKDCSWKYPMLARLWSKAAELLREHQMVRGRRLSWLSRQKIRRTRNNRNQMGRSEYIEIMKTQRVALLLSKKSQLYMDDKYAVVDAPGSWLSWRIL